MKNIQGLILLLIKFLQIQRNIQQICPTKLRNDCFSLKCALVYITYGMSKTNIAEKYFLHLYIYIYFFVASFLFRIVNQLGSLTLLRLYTYTQFKIQILSLEV